MSAAIIRAMGLTKRFGDFTAVDNLSIAVRPGSILAFLGANGSGKSTTIRMLIGLLRPTAGTIEVDGIDVVRHPRRVRDHIGYMGQKVSLYQGLSLRENVDFYGGLYGLAGVALEQRWGTLSERFGLADTQADKVEDLPAGVRQRAGLALSTLHEPPLLFLDEPTAGVDVHNRDVFWELIHDEAAKGVTVFVTTHFLEEADHCDWVCFIDRGRLIANAAPEALRERYSDGYEIALTLAPERCAAVAERLAGLGSAVRATDRGLAVTAAALGAPLLAYLTHLTHDSSDTRIQIAQPPMTDIFRRVLQEAGDVQ